jgi:hypothetical protein
MNLVQRGAASMGNFLLNLPYGFKLALLAKAFTMVLAKALRRKKKKKKSSEPSSGAKPKQKHSRGGKHKQPRRGIGENVKKLSKREAACKRFTAAVKKLSSMSRLTPAQERALKAARVGKKKYCS